MQVTKRDGSIENYTQSKIIAAIGKSFASTENLGHQKEIEEMALEVENFLKKTPANVMWKTFRTKWKKP